MTAATWRTSRELGAQSHPNNLVRAYLRVACSVLSGCQVDLRRSLLHRSVATAAGGSSCCTTRSAVGTAAAHQRSCRSCAHAPSDHTRSTNWPATRRLCCSRILESAPGAWPRPLQPGPRPRRRWRARSRPPPPPGSSAPDPPAGTPRGVSGRLLCLLGHLIHCGTSPCPWSLFGMLLQHPLIKQRPLAPSVAGGLPEWGSCAASL